jgi:hypothetical protein
MELIDILGFRPGEPAETRVTRENVEACLHGE